MADSNASDDATHFQSNLYFCLIHMANGSPFDLQFVSGSAIIFLFTLAMEIVCEMKQHQKKMEATRP